MADGHPYFIAQAMPVADPSRSAAELAGALARVQAYLRATQHRPVSEDSWWQGFSRVFMELEAQSCNPIALEIAVDQLLTRHGSTSWSVQRSRMSL